MKLIVLALACLAFFASAQVPDFELDPCTEVGVIIDDFQIRQGEFDKTEVIQGVNGEPTSVHPYTGAAHDYIFESSTWPLGAGAPNNILGGHRDVIVYIDQETSPSPPDGQGIRFNINEGPLNGGPSIPQVRYSTDQGLNGIGEIQWDGHSDSDSPEVFVKSGLGGMDLRSQAEAFTIELSSTDLRCNMRVEAWSYAGGVEANSRGVFFEWDPSSTSEQVFRFSEFSPIGAAVDPESVFADLGALRLFVEEDESANPEIDKAILSLGFVKRYCLYKSVARNTELLGSIEGLFGLFFEDDEILSGECDDEDTLEIGDRVTYFIQAYSEGTTGQSYTVRDVLDPGLSLVPGTIRTFTHDIPGLTATVINSPPGTLAVRIDVPSDLPNGARVTIFYDAIVTAAAVDLETCIGLIPNRATLDFGGASLINSVHFTGDDLEDRPTLVCLAGEVSFEFTQTISVEEAEFEDVFIVTSTFRNLGNINALNTFITMEFIGADAEVVSSGFSQVGANRYIRALGTLQSSNTPTVMNVQVRPLEQGQLTIRCCLTNLNSTAPDFCKDEICRDITVEVRALANVKICKKARIIRRLIYEIDYFNSGEGDAAGIVIQETIPRGTHFNPELSDSRWECDPHDDKDDPEDENLHCRVFTENLGSGLVDCLTFVVDLHDDTHVCQGFNNTVTVSLGDDAEFPDEDLTDNIATHSILPEFCPLPPPPVPPQCCECPEPPPPPAMCPCPEVDPCDQCWEQGVGYDHDSCDGKKSGPTFNFDFDKGSDIV